MIADNGMGCSIHDKPDVCFETADFDVGLINSKDIYDFNYQLENYGITEYVFGIPEHSIFLRIKKSVAFSVNLAILMIRGKCLPPVMRQGTRFMTCN